MRKKYKYPDKAGIYKLTCIINNKIYIGKAVNFRKRIENHEVCNERTKNKYALQRAIIKYGWDSFDVEIIEIFENFDKKKDNDNLLERESFYIKLYDSTNKDKGYNICEYSMDRTGTKHSKEARMKMSNSRIGKKFSQDTKEKISKSLKGIKRSEKSIETMRLKQRGKTYRLGMKHCEESKEKMSIAALGRKRSDETKEKIRQARLGKKHCEETKEKIRRSIKNHFNPNEEKSL